MSVIAVIPHLWQPKGYYYHHPVQPFKMKEEPLTEEQLKLAMLLQKAKEERKRRNEEEVAAFLAEVNNSDNK